MRKRFLSLLLIALLTTLLPMTGAHADDEEDDGRPRGFIKQPYNAKPPQEHHDGITASEWTFQTEGDQGSARGKVRVSCYSDDKDSFRMDLSGMKTRSVYTVWFTTSSRAGAERAGIGNPPFSFKTGGGGNVLYQAPLSSCPLGKYKWVEVRLHPDGDASNVEGSVRVLKARMHQE